MPDSFLKFQFNDNVVLSHYFRTPYIDGLFTAISVVTGTGLETVLNSIILQHLFVQVDAAKLCETAQVTIVILCFIGSMFHLCIVGENALL